MKLPAFFLGRVGLIQIVKTASVLAIASLLAVTSVSVPGVLNVFVTNLPTNPDGSLKTSEPKTIQVFGTEIELIPLEGIASPSYPPDLTLGTTYTVAVFRSLQVYTFHFIFNPKGGFQKVTRIDLTILSHDCYSCPSRMDFMYSFNGIQASSSTLFPGLSGQGPVTTALRLDTVATSSVVPGINEFTLDLQVLTNLSNGTTKTDFPLGVYTMALLIEYNAFA